MRISTTTLGMIALAVIPCSANAITIEASFDAWVRDDGATVGGRDGDLISVWSSSRESRWGVLQFDVSSLAGVNIETMGLNLWSQAYGSSDDSTPLMQTAALVTPGVDIATLDWAGVTALTQTPLETMGAYDLGPVNSTPIIQDRYLYSPASDTDISAVQSIISGDGLLTVFLMAVEDENPYSKSWGDAEYAGLNPQLLINDVPPEVVELTLEIDSASGMASISNPGGEVPFDFDGYVISSPAGVLNVSSWTSLQDQAVEGWGEVAPSDTAVTELNLDGSIILNPGESLSLGALFGPGAAPDEELQFTYNLAGGAPVLGAIEYVTVEGVTGDYNGDGEVNAADYTVWRDTLANSDGDLRADGNGDSVIDAADFAVWKENFGASASASVSSAAVPEASSVALLGLALVTLAGYRTRRHG